LSGMTQNIAQLRRMIRHRIVQLLEAKSGGGLTDLGALRRVARSDALSQMRSEIEAADGDVPAAAERLDVAPSTLYLAIQQEPSLEKSKEKADKDEEMNSKKESMLRWKYYNMLLEAPEEQQQLPEPPPDYAKKIAAKLANAAEGGVGLMTDSYDKTGIAIVLYKTSVFVGNTLASLNTETGSGGDTQVIADATEKSIVGMIVIDKAEDSCNDAMVVKYVFAKEGYGPTLYIIAMQFSPSGRIISDRGAVTPQARGMYSTLKQRGDIEKKPLDDNNIPMNKRKTPDDPSDDCEVWNHKGQRPEAEFLDYSYGGASIDTNKLKDNHKEAMKILNRHVQKYLGWAPDFASDYISTVASSIFMTIYHKIPKGERGLKNP